MNDYERILEDLGGLEESFAGKNILLTGSEGFLGQLFKEFFRYVNKTISSPCRVISIDKFGGDEYGEEPFIRINIANDWAVHDIFCHEELRGRRINYIINAAGIASPRNYEKYPEATMDVSYLGTKNILRLASLFNAEVLCFSSSEIYGNPTKVPTPESYVGRVEIYSDRGCYDIGKMALEELCYIYRKLHGVNSQIVRPFNVVGYMKNDGRVVPTFFEKLIRGEDIQVFEPGQQTRTFCWFTDFIVGAIKVLLLGDGKPYNIGNPNNEISMLDLAHKIESVAGFKDKVKTVPTIDVYKTEPMRRCPCIERARRDLQYEPKVELDEMLVKFWIWAKENYK